MKLMNKYLLLPFLLLISALAAAQSFELDHEELYLQTEDLTKFEYVVYSHINSTIAQDQQYYWEKNIVDCPADWQVSMCIGELCYFHTTHFETEDLDAGERGEYSLHLANTQGESGMCTWETKFVTVGTTDTIYVMNTWVLGVSSADELEQFQFSFYPNPVQEMLNVNVELPVELVIGNTLGQSAVITDVPAGNSVINLSDLNRGLYTISFNYKGKNLFTRQFVKK